LGAAAAGDDSVGGGHWRQRRRHLYPPPGALAPIELAALFPLRNLSKNVGFTWRRRRVAVAAAVASAAPVAALRMGPFHHSYFLRLGFDRLRQFRLPPSDLNATFLPLSMLFLRLLKSKILKSPSKFH